MRIEKLTVKGVGPFEEEIVIDAVGLDDIVAVSGRNGVGKTFLLECVPGAIYGYFPFRMHKQSETIYDMMKKGDKSYMEIVFTIGGRKFRIDRTISIRGKWVGEEEFEESGKGHSAICEEWIDGKWVVVAEKTRGVDEFVEREICAKQLFLASCFNSQNSAGDIVDCGEDERKQVFSRIIGLGDLQDKADLFGKRAGVVEQMVKKQDFFIDAEKENMSDEVILGEKKERAVKEIEMGKVAVEAADAVLEGLMDKKAKYDSVVSDIAKMKEKRWDVVNGFEGKKQRVNKLKELVGKKDELQKLKDKKMWLKDTLGVLEAEYERFEEVVCIDRELKDKIGVLEAKLLARGNELSGEMNILKNDLGVYERRLDNARVKLKEAKGYCEDAAILGMLECEKNCGYVEKAVKAQEWLKENPVVKFQEEVEKAEKVIVEQKEKIESFKQYVDSKQWGMEWNNELGEIREKRIGLEGKIDRMKEIGTEIKKMKVEIAAIEGNDIDGKLGQIEAAGQELPILVGEIEDGVKAVERVDDELEQLELRALDNPMKEIAEWKQKKADGEGMVLNGNKLLAVCEEAEKRNVVAVERIKDMQKRGDALRQLKGDYDGLSRAFGRSGIQALVIDAEKSQFLDIAKELFEILSGGKMMLGFETQRELKSGAKKEGFDLVLTVEGKKRKLEQCSQGQQDLGRIVMRATLGIYHAMKTGSRIQTYFLDETTGSLDEINREGYFNFLNYLSKYFQQIFVISHQDITASIPCQIRITDDHRVVVA